MISSRPTFSLGALAVILCLALPMGVLSLFAPTSTSDELASADGVIIGRVAAVQVGAPGTGASHLVMRVTERLLGGGEGDELRFVLEGRSALRAGDTVMALVGYEPNELLGSYQLRKDDLGYLVSEPITGFWAEGLSDAADQPIEDVIKAFQIRLGLIDPDADPVLDDDASSAAPEGDDEIGDDFLEDNDILADASPIDLNPPVALTGTNPVKITGLTLTDGDIDFFGFEVPGLTILHAETMLPQGVTSMSPDTLISLFDGDSGELLADDDDSGPGKLSRLVVPLEKYGINAYALSVEAGGAPATGAYELQLELERASYISNTSDLIVGVSSDGTFIEDFIGYKKVGGADVLIAGVPADGWSLSYQVPFPPSEGGPTGLTSVIAGAGEFLVEPSFNHIVRPLGFSIIPHVDQFGANRAGAALSDNYVGVPGLPNIGVRIDLDYTASVNQNTLKGLIVLETKGSSRIRNASFERLLDVDLYDEDGDTFTWSFPADGGVRAFPVPTTDTVGSLTDPDSNTGTTLPRDMQVALTVDSPEDLLLGAGTTIEVPMAATLVHDFVTESDAVDAAGQNLLSCGVDAWIIVSDDDPETGMYSAFGIGLADFDLR